MTAREIMTKDVFVIAADDKAQHAVEIMAHNDISGLPVVDAEDKLVGIVTERDLLMIEQEGPPLYKTALYGLWITPQHLMEQDAQRRGLFVSDVMTKNVITFGPDDKAVQIAATMREKGINRVPIVDGDEIVGIVSRHDIMKALAEGKSLA